ncbi:MAG: 50S ribosomal protein L19 [Fusobacteriota bacterium]
MKEALIQAVENEYLREDLPAFRVGDTINVHYTVKEGSKERIQMLEGVVIRMSGTGVAKKMTVRKISFGGIGVERIIPVNSPFIHKIEVKKFGNVRRSKLYYLRDRKGKAARIKEKK